MYRILSSIILLLLLPTIITAQECDCSSSFQWLKKTFEANDAGFKIALQTKGKDAYNAHNKYIETKIKNAKSKDACLKIFNEWVTFFRAGHVYVRAINEPKSNIKKPSDEDIINQFKEWERYDFDLDAFKAYLKLKKTQDYEGIWSSSPYKIGIKKVNDVYLGFIIDADGVYWRKGQIKLKINPDGTAVYFMKNHSAQTYKNVKLNGSHILQLGYLTFTRVNDELKLIPDEKRLIKVVSTTQPYFEMLNKQTAYLRIHSFMGYLKGAIDSVINANKNKIYNTENLIIDLRNNGGGSDRSYSALLPIIYTDTMRTVGVEMYSTKLNNQRMLEFINNPNYGFSEEGKKWAKTSYDTLSKHLGTFINLNKTVVTHTVFDTVHTYPKKVGIIINDLNASTTEQFLLAAKQSKKVKLFGTTTAGILDISNMHEAKSPCNNYALGYCLSRSLRIPGMAIDGKGIQPDFFIDKSIPAHKWIKFVNSALIH